MSNKINSINLNSVGFVSNDRKTPLDDNWGDVISKIYLSSDVFDLTATAGLNDFNYIEVVFYMDQVKKNKINTSARHPRNDGSLPKIGILAQRGKNRPNQIGISYAKLLEVDGLELLVQGLDAIDKSPILDIKPCFKSFFPKDKVLEPSWTSIIMSNYY